MPNEPAISYRMRVIRLAQVFSVGFVVLAIVVEILAHDVLQSAVIVTAIFVLGIVMTTVALLWGTRWARLWLRTVYLFGLFCSSFSIVQFTLNGQNWLALGALILLIGVFYLTLRIYLQRQAHARTVEHNR
jgi:hypothetical protein